MLDAGVSDGAVEEEDVDGVVLVDVSGLVFASPDSEPDDESAAALSPLFLFDLLGDLRSILAQPEPLKWTVGATNALRIEAPQTGHAVGPASWMPCITSVVWPFAQTYSYRGTGRCLQEERGRPLAGQPRSRRIPHLGQ